MFGQPEVGRRTGEPDHHQRLHLGLRKAGEARAIAVDEADAATGSAVGVDRDPRRVERVDVAIDRAARHAKSMREGFGRERSLDLEFDQDRQETVGTRRDRMPKIADKGRQLSSLSWWFDAVRSTRRLRDLLRNFV